MVNKKVTKTNEQTFYDILKAFFVGLVMEGQGGFVKLFKARQTYYQKLVTALQQEIEKHNNLKEDIYGLLNEFLIFSARQHSFWDMQKWFYYVKTDIVFQSMSIEADGFTFFFDVSQVSYKKNNEKRNIVYELKEAKDDTVVFLVHYKEGNTATNIETILKALGNKITETELRKVFRKYERKIKQTERDFFIHKDVRSFLQEKLKLWFGEYIYHNEITKDNAYKLQVVKEIAHKLIDLIGNFEDVVLQLWNVPKAVVNANYVITLDRIAEHGNKGLQVIDMILNHKNIKPQIEEWQALGIVDNGFSAQDIKSNFEKYKHLPIDTKYFKDIENNIINLFDNLDNALDGLLIKSENWQALNTILNKYREKIKTIYIDPPYNTGSDDFLYRDSYQHSSWLTMMENRLSLAKELMSDDGVIFVSIDDREQENLKTLMKVVFGDAKFLSQIIRDIPDGTNLRTIGGIKTSTEYIISFLKEKEPIVNNLLFKDPIYREIVKNEVSDFIETRLTKRGNSLSGILFPRGIGRLRENLNLVIKEGNYINPSSRERILVKKGNLIIKDGILQEDVLLEAPWSMPNVLKELFAGREVYDDSGQKYEYVFFNNNGIPYILKSRGKTLIPSYLKVRNKTDELFVDIFGYDESPKGATVKPVELIYLLISFYTDKNNIVIDFFAGSGTTAHAVMKLNKEDGGKRKFILVEMGNYFDTVIIPRVKKVAYSFNWRDGKPQDADGIGVFFKYYELEQFDDVLNKLDSIISNYLIADIKP